MNRILAAALPLAVILAVGCSTHHQTTTATGKTVYGEQAQIIERMRNAGQDLKQLMNTPDAAIPQTVLADAKCIAVIPDMVKGGFVIGGNHGRGVATCRLPNGNWTQPAFMAITGGSWGAQIGLESVDLVMVFLGDAGAKELLTSQFKLGANAGVAAGPIGRQAQASTDWKMQNKILVYSRAKGLFAGLDLSGASVKPDDDSTRAYYGNLIPFDQILSGKAPANPNSKLFLADVREAFHVSNVNKQEKEPGF
ncbi:MAG TPA: lipid-binding SYLF domain-containing protein [Candidatus Acidoferrales bacterium]|jgi:lipid-binding SYLF domain-containing protein|nr:lipid-binding SYLF domain-containing protein [Candidatus Acidoferrales bacterium]